VPGSAWKLPLALLLALGSARPIFSAEQWLKIASTHFELYTTAGEKKGREAVLYFEQVRSLFEKIAKPGEASKTPVRIVAFQSEKQYKPYRLNQAADAYYVGGPGRDYIVMKSIAPEDYPVALHEYFHLIVQHSALRLPVWLNEGMAEIYSTAKPVGKRVQIGEILPGRFREMQTNRWLDLDTLLSVKRGSPLYTEKDPAGMFYAESWALAHMLYLSNEYWQKFADFLMQVRPDETQAATFQRVYGKSLAEVTHDLEQYLRGTLFNAAVFNVKLEKSAEEPDVRPATAVESDLALAELLAITRKKDEARAAYESLARANPKDAQIELGWARLAGMNRDREGVKLHLERAIELGINDGKVYFDYAMLLHESGGKDAEMAQMLRKAVELSPDLDEAHYNLGFYAMTANRFWEAVINLQQVKKLKKEQAPSYFRALAYAYYRLGKPEEGKKNAETALRYSTDPNDVEMAKKLLTYGTQSAGQPAEPAPDGRPRLKRRDTSPAPDPPQ
jgi:tetratricopeptide (TPR) repeat protein